MICHFCKGELETSTTEYIEKQGNVVVIIENIPCEKCRQCGETYFSTAVAEKINDILDSAKNISSMLTVTVVDYSEAAA